MATYLPRIAIIGGGPAGFTLGRLLHLRGIRAPIYELRAKPTAKDLDKPSGMLDLHDESGLSAIRACGIYDKFLELTGECSEECKVYNYEGELLHHDYGHQSPEEARPEISRHQLMELLISGMPDDMVKWNHKVEAVSRQVSPSGRTEITVDFGLNGKETFDFVVGADGAWSATRSLLTPVKPHYNGCHFIWLDLKAVSTRYPQIADFLGSGSTMNMAFHNGVLTQRGANGAARIYLAVGTPDEKFGNTFGLTDKTSADAKGMLLEKDELFAKWAPVFKQIIGTACDEQTEDDADKLLEIKPMYALPAGSRWDSRTGVTLVGDAAHLMSPFAGEGVNLAMWDSLDVAAKIDAAVKARADSASAFHHVLQPLIREYEESMFVRAGEKAEESQANQSLFLDSVNGSDQVAKFFQGLGGQQPR